MHDLSEPMVSKGKSDFPLVVDRTKGGPSVRESDAPKEGRTVFRDQVDRAENEEGQGGGGLSTSSAGCSGASGSRMGPGPDSGSSAPSSVPHSLATSRDDEDEEDEESSGRRSNGHTGTRSLGLLKLKANANSKTCYKETLGCRTRRHETQTVKLRHVNYALDYTKVMGPLVYCSKVVEPTTILRLSSELYRRGTFSSHGGSLEKDAPGLSATSTTSESLESNGLDTEIPAAARRPRSTRGSQKWSNVRAVMALYSSLRKIKSYTRRVSPLPTGYGSTVDCRDGCICQGSEGLATRVSGKSVHWDVPVVVCEEGI
ncbi:hypothetical protein WN48_00340 [Eufriesea mexicana]|uniref:Uncharacterized protein n=1 Tax=Eufriesea mexicana TaxID=516756 RepID=A0A310S5E0_9HYME|nr:hypothetical protein WN48_00340 [Eufriesea mexicana]